jgi:hypothetical protein
MVGLNRISLSQTLHHGVIAGAGKMACDMILIFRSLVRKAPEAITPSHAPTFLAYRHI